MSFSKSPLSSLPNVALLVLLLLSGSLFAATPVEDVITRQVSGYLKDSLDNFLQGYPDATFSITVRPIKKQPDQCQKRPNVSRRSERRPPIGAVRLTVECPGQWRQHVTADVDVEVSAVHVRKALSRGDVISPDVLQLIRVPWEKLRADFFQNPGRVSGRQLRRALSVGSLVTESALVPDYLVHKGKVVTILAGNGSLHVSMVGVALESGLLSETIRVRNRSSGKVVDAQVIAKNKVQAGP